MSDQLIDNEVEFGRLTTYVWDCPRCGCSNRRAGLSIVAPHRGVCRSCGFEVTNKNAIK